MKKTDALGAASLVSGNASAALIEPFFGSSVKRQVATDEPYEMQALARPVLVAMQDAIL